MVPGKFPRREKTGQIEFSFESLGLIFYCLVNCRERPFQEPWTIPIPARAPVENWGELKRKKLSLSSGREKSTVGFLMRQEQEIYGFFNAYF